MTTWEPLRKDSQLWRLDDSNCLVNKAHPHMCLAPTGYKPWQKLMLRPKSHAYGPNWQKWRFEADGDSEYYRYYTSLASKVECRSIDTHADVVSPKVSF